MLSIRACFKSLPCLHRRDVLTPADTAAPTQPAATLPSAETAASAKPAAALPSAIDLGVSEEKLKLWRERGGDALEPVLESGAVAVLDAQWIIAKAGGRWDRKFDASSTTAKRCPRRPSSPSSTPRRGDRHG